MHVYYIWVIHLRWPLLIIKHSVTTTASPTAIWQVWQDVTSWHSWNHGIEFSTIDGPFKTGITGTLKPKGGPFVHTTLTHVEPMKAFFVLLAVDSREYP